MVLRLAMVLLPLAAFSGWLGLRESPRQTFGDAVYVPPATSAVRYASLVGCKDDGTYDNTATVQAILDAYGAAGTPLEFVFDGPGTYLFAGTIYEWGNQTIVGVGWPTLKKAGYSSSNGWALISNKHPTTTGTGQTDQHLALRDLYIDGNRRGYACGVNNSSTPYINASQWVVPTIGWYGVAHAEMSGVQVYDSPAFGFHFGNCLDVLVVGCSRLNAGDTIGGDDNIHFQGGCDGIRVVSFYGASNDDSWSFCPNDGNDLASPLYPYKPGTVLQGPITHCSIRDSTFVLVNGSQGQIGRFLSSNPSSSIEDIVIANCTMYGAFRGVSIDNFGITLGNGKYNAITFESCTVYLSPASDGGSTPQFIWAGAATIDRIAIRNCILKPTGAISPVAAIQFSSASTVTTADIQGLYLDDPSGYLSSPIIQFGGTVTTAEVGALVTNRGTQSTLSQPAISCTGTMGRLRVVGGHIDRMSNVVNVSAGTTSIINAAGGSHTNASGAKSFLASGSGTWSTLNAAAFDTSLLGP